MVRVLPVQASQQQQQQKKWHIINLDIDLTLELDCPFQDKFSEAGRAL